MSDFIVYLFFLLVRLWQQDGRQEGLPGLHGPTLKGPQALPHLPPGPHPPTPGILMSSCSHVLISLRAHVLMTS